MALLTINKPNNCLYLAEQHYNNIINTDNVKEFRENVILGKYLSK